jgi:amidase
MSVIAGADGLDPRQRTFDRPRDYLGALSAGIAGLKIGVLEEGFGRRNAEPEVEAAVRNAAAAFTRLGAIVSRKEAMPATQDDLWKSVAPPTVRASISAPLRTTDIRL